MLLLVHSLWLITLCIWVLSFGLSFVMQDFAVHASFRNKTKLISKVPFAADLHHSAKAL